MEYEDKIDLKGLFLKYRAWWPFFFISIPLAIFAAYVFNEISEPVYLAKTTILISEDHMASPLAPNLSGILGRESWHNEIAILKSRTLVGKTLQDMEIGVSYYETEKFLGLTKKREIYMNAPFRVKWDIKHPQPFEKKIRISILSEFSYALEEIVGSKGRQIFKFGDHVKGEGHSFLLEWSESFDKEYHKGKKYEFIIHNPSDLTRRYNSNLYVEPVGREYSVLEVTFIATNLKRAVDFVNNLNDKYIQQHLAEKNHIVQNTISFVDDQLAEVSENLRNTELNLQQYRQRQQIMEVGPMATQLSEELKQLDMQKSIEQVKSQYYDLLMEYVSDEVEFSEVFGPSAFGIDDPMLNSILLNLSTLHNERARMLITTTASSPSVQAIDENIRHSKENLKENIRSLKAANEIMINDLNKRITRIEERINQLPETERELINIQRLFNLNETTYNFLLEKRAEAGIGLASMIPDHKIIDPAHLDGIIAPRKFLNYAMAVGLSILLPFIFIGIRDFLNSRIIDIDTVKKLVDYPIVGIIPHYPKIKSLRDPNPVLFDENRSSFVEAFRSMRSNLLLLIPQSKSKLIVVTSTREKEGKTFTAVNLAGSFHMLNRKTIYINADMRKPSTLFNDNISKNGGLANYLTGDLDPETLINQSGQNNNLYLIPSGKMPPNASELLESEAMDQLLERLQSFEYIIIDTPPIGLVSDAMPLLTRADIIIYMVRHGYSLQSDLDFLLNLTRTARPKNVAIAINDVKKTGTYGYGYGYGYGLGYGVGYGTETKYKKK